MATTKKTPTPLTPLQNARAEYLEALDREMEELARYVERYQLVRKTGRRPFTAARQVGDRVTRVVGLATAYEALCEVEEG